MELGIKFVYFRSGILEVRTRDGEMNEALPPKVFSNEPPSKTIDKQIKTTSKNLPDVIEKKLSPLLCLFHMKSSIDASS